MKAKIFPTFFLIIIGLITFAQTTINSGDWETATIWPPVGSPGLTLTNNVTVETGHDVFIGTPDVKKNITLQDNNPTILTIKGILIINGDLTVTGNNWRINVLDGAVFKITGNVNFTQPSNGNAAPNLEINGVAEIGGNLSGSGRVTGTGSLTVDGEIGSGITINPDVEDSVNVIGNSTTYCPPRFLTAEVNFTGAIYSVLLKWEYDAACGAISFEIKRTLNDAITINTITIENNMEFSWNDIDNLTAESNPIYEVSAIYPNSIKSIAAEVSFLNSALPIELIYFTAETANNIIHLNWATATEINNDFFTIERSTNGHNWEIIDYLQGAGNANYVINYEYTDNNPVAGISYYRLKQTDYDGKFEYFAPVAVEFNQMKSAAAILNVTYTAQKMDIYVANENPNAYLLVSDIQGRVIGQYQIGADDFTQSISVNFPRNYSGEIVMVRLVSNDLSDEKKYIIR